MNKSLYDTDILLWSEKQVSLLQSKKFNQLDLENIIEEIESLGKSERDSFLSSIRLIIQHLLKWEYQPELRSKSWKDTIDRERLNLIDYLEDTPSLVRYWDDLSKPYNSAKRRAAKETEKDISDFPESCPYNKEQIESDWFPEY